MIIVFIITIITNVMVAWVNVVAFSNYLRASLLSYRGRGNASHVGWNKALSCRAGVQLAVLEAALPGCRVVRCMPNTPALLQQGASVFSRGQRATQQDALLTTRQWRVFLIKNAIRIIRFFLLSYRLLYKRTVHGKSLSITTDSNSVIQLILIHLMKLWWKKSRIPNYLIDLLLFLHIIYRNLIQLLWIKRPIDFSINGLSTGG